MVPGVVAGEVDGPSLREKGGQGVRPALRDPGFQVFGVMLAPLMSIAFDASFGEFVAETLPYLSVACLSGILTGIYGHRQENSSIGLNLSMTEDIRLLITFSMTSIWYNGITELSLFPTTRESIFPFPQQM